ISPREDSDNLTRLVERMDAAKAKKKEWIMGRFVVLCSDDEGLEAKLKDLAKKEDLKKVVLTIDNPQGPQRYKIAKEADVTVVLYQKHTVKANYAFKKGELHEKDVETIVADLSKILPDKGTK